MTLIRALATSAVLAAASSTAPALAQPAADPARIITAQPYIVRILANGHDVSARSPIATVRYLPDGSGWRRLRDGSLQTAGAWRFLNDARTQIEVQGPEGTSRWVIVELNARTYRKVNLDTGVEFIQTPVAE